MPRRTPLTPAQRLARRARAAADGFYRTGEKAPLVALRAELSTAWLAAHADRDGRDLFWINAACNVVETTLECAR